MPGASSGFYAIPYPMRLLLVLFLLALVAGMDWLKNRRKATRWREYLFWLTCASLAAVFATANDLITSTISKQYFSVGKGIGAGASFTGQVVGLAAQAGFLAGILIGGALLMANNPKQVLPRLTYGRLFAFLGIPLAGAVLLALPGFFLGALDLFSLRESLSAHLTPDEVKAFLEVQGIHLGLYLGATFGTVTSLVLIRKKRKSESPSKEALLTCPDGP